MLQVFGLQVFGLQVFGLRVAGCLLLLAAPAAMAQPVRIAQKATYADAVVCYEYYSLTQELARKIEADSKTSADAAAGFELQALAAGQAMALWSKYLGETAGKRTQGQIDADVRTMGAPVIADANASLTGDKDANKRGVDRGKKCAGFVVVGP